MANALRTPVGGGVEPAGGGEVAALDGDRAEDGVRLGP